MNIYKDNMNKDSMDNMTTETTNQTDPAEAMESNPADSADTSADTNAATDAASSIATPSTGTAELDEEAETSTVASGTRYFFATDAQGDWIDAEGNRYTAHAGVAFHTPQGLNAGCPQAASAEEAAAMKGLVYDPLEAEEPEAGDEASAPAEKSSTDNNGNEQ